MSRLACAIAALLAIGCEGRTPPSDRPADGQLCAGVRVVVQKLGERLKTVSLLAPDSSVRRQITEAYAELLTPDLLSAWMANPRQAPGRDVSSPWPERIEIDSVLATAPNECRVVGRVVYITSAGSASGEAALRVPVTLRLRLNGDWRVSEYQAALSRAIDSTSAAAAADVLRDYFSALAARNYSRAYALWEDGGKASGRSLEEFAASYTATRKLEFEIGIAGRMEPAAGSRYVKIPVVVLRTIADGTQERWEGSYVLRRSVVPGATAEQSQWRIHSVKATQR